MIKKMESKENPWNPEFGDREGKNKHTMKKAFLFISTAFLLSSCAAVKSPVTGYVYQETQSPYNI